MMSDDLRSRLEALAAKATPGPWHVGCQNDALFLTAGRPPALSNDHPWHDAPRVALAKVYDQSESDVLPIEAETNAALIVALVNALPEIIAALSAAARVRELEGALRDPPKHHYWGAGEPNCPREIKAGNGGTLPNNLPVIALSCSNTASGAKAANLPTVKVNPGTRVFVANFTRNTVNPGLACKINGSNFRSGADENIPTDYTVACFEFTGSKWRVVERL